MNLVPPKQSDLSNFTEENVARRGKMQHKQILGEFSRTPKRMRKLSNLDVADFIEKKGIKSETELLAIANEQEGKKDLADFALSRNSKSLKDLIEQTWKMKEALSALERRKTPRMDSIR